MEIPNPPFFWDTLYHVMMLNVNHMLGSWSEGYIVGFVFKDHAEELLMAMEGGTFLLHFSDSELGRVSIAYVCNDAHNR